MNTNHAQSMTQTDVRELWAETIIDGIRFRSRTDRVLARYEDVTALLPSADELKEQGADIVAIATALENGLSARALRTAVRNGIDLAAFSKALNTGLDVRAFTAAIVSGGLRVKHFAGMVESLDMDTLNGGLEHVVEHRAEVRQFPRLVDRLVHRAEACYA